MRAGIWGSNPQKLIAAGYPIAQGFANVHTLNKPEKIFTVG